MCWCDLDEDLNITKNDKHPFSFMCCFETSEGEMKKYWSDSIYLGKHSPFEFISQPVSLYIDKNNSNNFYIDLTSIKNKIPL